MTATSCCAPCSPSPTTPVLCFFCGEPEVVELFEIWGHEFMWETLPHIGHIWPMIPLGDASCCAASAQRCSPATSYAAWPTTASAAWCSTGSSRRGRSRSRPPAPSCEHITRIVGHP